MLDARTQLVGTVEERLAQAGLPPLSWYDVLLPLHLARGSLRMGGLAAAVITIGRTGLIRLADRLESEGLILRRHSVTDRRGVEIEITNEGSALLRKMWPVYAQVIEDRFVAVLDADGAARLGELLTTLTGQREIPPLSPLRSAGSPRWER